MHIKLRLFFLPVLLIPSFLPAQNVEIGLRGGLNIGATEYVDRKNEFKDVAAMEGVAIAVPVLIHLKKGFALQSEFSYVQKGNSFYKVWPDETGAALNINRTNFVLNYLEALFLAKWSFGAPKLGIDLLAGPSFGFGLNGYYAYGDRKTFTVHIDPFSFHQAGIRTPDANLNFGVGVHAGHIFVDARYQVGLIDIATDNQIARRIYHSGVNLNIGALFPMDKKRN